MPPTLRFDNPDTESEEIQTAADCLYLMNLLVRNGAVSGHLVICGGGGADVNIPDSDGLTPLGHVLKAGNGGMVQTMQSTNAASTPPKD